MKAIYLLFLIVCPLIGLAGNLPTSVGGRAMGMGGFNVTFSDGWSAGNNVAGMAKLKHASLGFYLENRFLVKELSYKAIAASIPTAKGAFGISAGRYGYSLFNDNKIGLSYSKLLGKKVSMGIQLNYRYTKIAEGYGTQSAVSGNIGLIAEVTEDLKMGAYVINPTKAHLSDYQDERYPSILIVGFSYDFSQKVTAGMQIDKNMTSPAIVRTGIEYQPINILYLRAGISTAPTISSFGFGLLFKNFQVDFASSFHSVLGFSPHISLLFSPSGTSKKKE